MIVVMDLETNAESLTTTGYLWIFNGLTECLVGYFVGYTLQESSKWLAGKSIENPAAAMRFLGCKPPCVRDTLSFFKKLIDFF